MRFIGLAVAVGGAILLAGCGEVDTSYSIESSPRWNRAAAALVESTAQELRLKVDKEGLSPTWRSYSSGALSYQLATKPGGSTSVFLADDRLRHKRKFKVAKQNLTDGLRRIDPEVQPDTRWHSNPMM